MHLWHGILHVRVASALCSWHPLRARDILSHGLVASSWPHGILSHGHVGTPLVPHSLTILEECYSHMRRCSGWLGQGLHACSRELLFGLELGGFP